MYGCMARLAGADAVPQTLRKYKGKPLTSFGSLIHDGDIWYEHPDQQKKGKVR